MSSESKDAILARIYHVDDGLSLLNLFDKTVPYIFKEVKKTYHIRTTFRNPERNSGQWIFELQGISRAFDIVSRYMFIKHNDFNSNEKK